MSQGGPSAHRGVHSRRSVHMVRTSATDAAAQQRVITEHWCSGVVVLKGGRCTGSCAAFTRVWPAGSSWTVCSSWRRSVATERSASLSSERSPPSWKVTLTNQRAFRDLLQALKAAGKVGKWKTLKTQIKSENPNCQRRRLRMKDKRKKQCEFVTFCWNSEKQFADVWCFSALKMMSKCFSASRELHQCVCAVSRENWFPAAPSCRPAVGQRLPEQFGLQGVSVHTVHPSLLLSHALPWTVSHLCLLLFIRLLFLVLTRFYWLQQRLLSRAARPHSHAGR